MKPKQLIKKLEKLPEDLEILVYNGEFWDKLATIKKEKYSCSDGEYYEDENGKEYYIFY